MKKGLSYKLERFKNVCFAPLISYSFRALFCNFIPAGLEFN